MRNGTEWRKSHHLTAKSLGVNVPVESKGNMFYCTSRFTLNKFAVALCQFAKHNGAKMPSREIVARWVEGANNRFLTTGHGDKLSTDPKVKIVVAETPEKVSPRMAMALNGGVLHESAHLLYTMQEDLDADTMWSIVAPRWAIVKDWSKYQGLLLQWINLVEDIVIERALRRNFVNTHNDLADLQDLILKMEGKDDDKVEQWREKATPLSIVGGAFRDIGLGYNTVLGRKAIALYKEFPKEWAMVTNGPLTPLLKEAIAVVDDPLASFRIAMSVVGIIAELAGDGADKPQEPEEDGGGESEYDPCPKCGASPSNLVIRGVYDDYGRKVKGKAMLVCRVCGHTQIIDVDTEGEGGGTAKGETPDFEDMDQDEPDSPEGGGGDGEGDGQGDDGEDADGEAGGSDKSDPCDDGEESDGNGGGDSDGDESEGDTEGDADGDGSDSGDADGDESSDGGGDSSKPPVFKVGDEAMLQGIKVRVTYAGAVKADGTQDLEVEPC